MASLIKIKELGLPLDEIIYSDIMFDENISAEHPVLFNDIKRLDKNIYDKYGLIVNKLKGKSFKELFYRVKKKGNHIGDNYGFPYTLGSWCTEHMKTRPIKQRYSILKKQGYNLVVYMGIAVDEKHRFERLPPQKNIIYKSVLIDNELNENECLELCKQNDLLSKHYENNIRSGCWFCPKQRLEQLYDIYKNHNELFKQLELLQKDSFNTFKINKSIVDVKKEFEKKDNQLSLFEINKEN